MKELLIRLPPVLRRQVLIQSAEASMFFVLFIAIWAVTGGLPLALPCLVLAVFLFVNTTVMLYSIFKGNCICIHGICSHIKRGGIRKQVKSVMVVSDCRKLIIPVHRKISGLSQGCGVALYLSDRAHVYEHNGTYIINSYFALTLEE